MFNTHRPATAGPLVENTMDRAEMAELRRAETVLPSVEDDGISLWGKSVSTQAPAYVSPNPTAVDTNIEDLVQAHLRETADVQERSTSKRPSVVLLQSQPSILDGEEESGLAAPVPKRRRTEPTALASMAGPSHQVQLNEPTEINPDEIVPSIEESENVIASIEDPNASGLAHIPDASEVIDDGFSGRAPNPVTRVGEFGWNCYRGETNAQRLLIKEAAANDAIEYSEKLCSKLEVAFSQLPTPISQADAEAYGIEDMKKWMAEAVALRESYRDFTTLVGVAGNTGSGKTSLLNAVLGLKDFLPTSQHEASTAVACQISWNHEAMHSQMFKAEIEFQDYEELRHDINEYLDALEDRAIIERGDEEYTTEQERNEVLADMERRLKAHRRKLYELFGHDDTVYQNADADMILESKPEVLELMGEKKVIREATAEEMARKLKPYLDSSGTVEVADGQNIAMWSLIKKVHVFLQADVLKHGISLVDLPGLGDAVESRAAVAQKFYDKLHVQIVVSPIVRAADEQTTTHLVTRYQEMSLRMEGKFGSNGLGIVLSKMDDLDPEAFAKGAKEFKNDERVKGKQEEIKKVRDEVKQLTKEASKLRTKINREMKNEAKRKKKSLPSKIPQLYDLVFRCDEEKAEKEDILNHLEGEMAFWCFRARNNLSIQRIQDDFLKRHERLMKINRADPDEDVGTDYDLAPPSVPVLPVSSKAFWSAKKKRSIQGLPTEAFSGVLHLRHWLVFEATAGRREEHLDKILHTYHRLLLGIQQWSKDRNPGDLNLAFSKISIENKLAGIHVRCRHEFTKHIKGWHKAIEALDPFKNHTDILEKFNKERVAIIESWPRRIPEDPDSRNMAWATFQAILKRSGGRYRASYGQTYNWLESLTVPLMELIYEDWDRIFQFELARILTPLQMAVFGVWERYVQEMKDAFYVGVSTEMGVMAQSSLDGISNIQHEIRYRLRDVIKDLQEEATAAREELLATLHSHMAPIFRKCLEITGPGQYVLRREKLARLAQGRAGSIMTRAWKRMRDKVDRAKASAGSDLLAVVPFAVDSSQRILSILLNRVFHSNPSTEDARAVLQREAEALHAGWLARWREGSLSEGQVRWAEGREIPEEFPAFEARGGEGEREGSEGGGGSEGSEAGSDLLMMEELMSEDE